MTWNGSWLQDHAELQLLCETLRQTSDALSAAAGDVPAPQSLLEEFWQQLRKEQKKFEWAQLSVCIEFSLNAEVKTRLHLHAFAEFSLRARVFPAGKATFQGCPCSHLSPSMGRKGPKGRDRAVREGHYYIQAPKLGHIDWRSTCPKFQVMMVNIDFVKRLWMSVHGGEPGAQLGCNCLCQLVPGLIFVAAQIQSVDSGWAVSYRED